MVFHFHSITGWYLISPGVQVQVALIQIKKLILYYVGL